MLTEIHIKASGKMIKPMVMVSIRMLKQEQNIRAIGKMTCSMDQVYKFLPMEINIRECLNKESEMEKGHIILQMAPFIKVNG